MLASKSGMSASPDAYADSLSGSGADSEESDNTTLGKWEEEMREGGIATSACESRSRVEI